MPVAESPRNPYTAIIAVIVLGAALIWAQAVIIPLVMAILLTFILTPLVAVLQRRGLRRIGAVLLVMGLTLAAVVALLFAIGNQLHTLAEELPSHKGHITRKVRELFGGGPGVISNLEKLFDEISSEVNKSDPAERQALPVELKKPGLARALLPDAATVALTLVGTIGLVLILTTSMLFTREDLRNRLIRLAGDTQLTRTTRALEEASRRISAYLIVQVILNIGFGTAMGLGLFLLGVPYAFLWGVLAAVLRFIPFIGTWLSGTFPLLVSITSEGWVQPIGVVLLVICLSVVTNSVIEPLLVSRRTGVSGIALVVSATFWTWLWGLIGLILATPMTVCLAVLGKHVPGLKFLDVLLGTEPVLEAHLGFYQRLLARDAGEATELVETYLEDHSRQELFDQVMIPTLVRAGEDREQGHINAEDTQFIERTTREILHDLEELEPAHAAKADPTDIPADVNPVLVLGFATHDLRGDLALEMLDRTIQKSYVRMEIVGSAAVTAEVVERVAETKPSAVCVTALPPAGMARARFLCKRLRVHYPELPIIVGQWGAAAKDDQTVAQLQKAGASSVTTSIKETLEQLDPILQVLAFQESEALKK
jgi:predicted PurR-regulated permease PerM